MWRRGLPGALLGLVILALGPSPAIAEPTPEAAGAARRAHEAGDEPGLRDLASRSDPDPWRVADLLLAAGSRDVALAFASAAPREETRALPRYVEGWAAREGEAALRAALAAAAALPEASVRAADLAALASGPDDVLEVIRLTALGDAHGAARDLLQAAATFERAGEVAERLGWWAAQADALYKAGSTLYDLGAFDEALATFRRRLSVETRLADPVGMGRARFAVGIALHQLARDRAAARHLETARELAESAGDHEYLAKMLATEAGTLAQQGKYASALERYHEAAQSLDRIGDATLAARFVASRARLGGVRIKLLLNASSMAGQAGRWSEFESLSGDAVAAAEALGDETVLLQTKGHTAGARGVVLQQRGAIADAADAYADALACYERLGDQVGIASYGRRLGSALVDQGEYVRALETLEVAEAALEATRARRHLPRVLVEMGTALTRLGEYERAHERYMTALDLAEELDLPIIELDALSLLAEHHMERGDDAESLRYMRRVEELELPPGVSKHEGALAIDLGHIRSRLGDHEKALALYEQAETLLEAERDERRLAVARNAIARIWILQGRHEEAREFLQQVLEGQRRRGDRVGQATTLGMLAHAAKQLAAGGAALELYEESIRLWEALEVPAQAARGRQHVAEVLLALGRVDAAQEVLGRVREVAERLQEPDLLALCYGGLAAASLQEGDVDAARSWSRRAADQLLFVGRNLAEGEGAELRAAFADVHRVGALAAARAGHAEDLYFFFEHGRAATLLEALGGRERLREAVLPPDARRAEARARTVEARAFADLRRARQDGRIREMRDAKTRLEGAREQVREVVRDIQRSTQLRSSAVLPTHVPLSEVKRGLKPDEALVLYGFLDPEPVALVLRSTGERIVSLGKTDELQAEIEALLREASPFVEASAAAPLAARLIGRLELDEGVRRVLLSPDGDLARVPFGLLVPEREVVLIPSATTHAWLRAQGAGSVGPGEVLAFGDPDYGTLIENTAAVAQLRGGADSLVRLPATADEAREVGDVVRVGGDASETRFRQDVKRGKRWRAVHLACHGLVDHARPTNSSLALTGDASNDGLLTALDVFRLQVPTDLAVLSGCETGLGRTVRGEGLFGLPRAFLQAGASSVLVSLWPVDDRATQAFMTTFYAAWNTSDRDERLPAAAALRKAQAHVREQEGWAHPRFWAGWVLWGRAD